MPYKLLSYLLYSKPGTYDFIHPLSDGVVRIQVGALARHFKTTMHRIYEAIDWLKLQGLIKSSKKFKGVRNVSSCQLHLETPRDYREDLDAT